MSAFEFNFDGLVGPTHNYSGLSFGNIASQINQGAVANPKLAALQGLEKMKALLNGDPAALFITRANSAAQPGWILWWDFTDKKIYCSPSILKQRSVSTPDGYDPKSASWMTVHEAAHAAIGPASSHTHVDNPGPADNAYSRSPGYYQMNWQQCLLNPDSYAHFAYHALEGKQNLGPWD